MRLDHRAANSHRLDSATRWKPHLGRHGANISPPRRGCRPASGLRVQPASAALSMPMALLPGGGGIDEWPGGPAP
jgi:hypothetical protein